MEAAISHRLWEWQCLSSKSREEAFRKHSAFHETLERYLTVVCQVVGFTHQRGIWCDGVKELSIVELHRFGFKLVGAMYGPVELAPFELELNFKSRRSSAPSRTIFRLGKAALDGEIDWSSFSTDPTLVVERRPTETKDWAVKVVIADDEI